MTSETVADEGDVAKDEIVSNELKVSQDYSMNSVGRAEGYVFIH